MQIAFRILANTPVWVFALLAYLTWQGWQARRPRTQAIWRMLIVPLVFFLMGLSRLVSARDHGVEPLMAWRVEAILLGAADAEVALANSVREAQQVLGAAAFDAAFLDIDVLDGKTFEVAWLLAERGTPFAFVSGARQEDVPPPLRQVPFLPKPYDPQDIERTFLARLAHQG